MWVDTVSCYISSMLMILFFAIQDVSGCHIPCYISYMLIMPDFGSTVCEWLLYLAAFLACWCCLPLPHQYVSSCIVLLHFSFAHHACLWLFSLCVAVVPWCNSSLLMIPVLDSLVGGWLLCLAAFRLDKTYPGSLESEWLLSLAVFQACWLSLLLAF